MRLRLRTTRILLSALTLIALGTSSMWFLYVRAWQWDMLHDGGKAWYQMLKRFRVEKGRWARDRKEFTESLSDDGVAAMDYAGKLDTSWTLRGDKLDLQLQTTWMWPPMGRHMTVVFDPKTDHRSEYTARYFKQP